MTQIFGRLPNTLAFADPFTEAHAHIYYMTGKLSKKEASKLIANFIKMRCRPLKQVSNSLNCYEDFINAFAEKC